MPRLPTSLLRQAYTINPFYAQLLPECRTLEDAANEFRWLKQHAISKSKESSLNQLAWRSQLRDLCGLRAQGVPLQYLLGSEYFGDIEIACQPGVLIPRPETAATTAFLASKLDANARRLPRDLRILDLCTGTGCITLLLRHIFTTAAASRLALDASPKTHLLGVDISNRAINLARLNKARLDATTDHGRTNLRFERADILSNSSSTPSSSSSTPRAQSLATLLEKLNTPNWDILVSNPPYISPHSFRLTTTRSVRLFEPRLALVPPSSFPSLRPVQASGSQDVISVSDEEKLERLEGHDSAADVFYPALLQIAGEVGVKIALMEVADMPQALRVGRLAVQRKVWGGVEIWRDGDLAVTGQMDGFDCRGDGDGRAVLCWRGAGANWLGLDAA